MYIFSSTNLNQKSKKNEKNFSLHAFVCISLVTMAQQTPDVYLASLQMYI